MTPAPLTLSSVQIQPLSVPNNGLVAFAQAVVNEQLFISSIAIFTSPGTRLGYRLQYPDKVISKSGLRRQCFYPITKEAAEVLDSEIVGKYIELMEKFTSSNNA